MSNLRAQTLSLQVYMHYIILYRRKECLMYFPAAYGSLDLNSRYNAIVKCILKSEKDL